MGPNSFKGSFRHNEGTNALKTLLVICQLRGGGGGRDFAKGGFWGSRGVFFKGG